MNSWFKTQVILFILSLFFAAVSYWLINLMLLDVTREVFYGLLVLYYLYFFLHPYSKEIYNEFEGLPPEPLTEKEKKKWGIK